MIYIYIHFIRLIQIYLYVIGYIVSKCTPFLLFLCLCFLLEAVEQPVMSAGFWLAEKKQSCKKI